MIDDASGDGTYERVLGLAAQDPRIKALRAEHNGGPGAARNIGLAHATGEWVALLDSDDRYRPERIATLCEVGERTGADLVADNLLLCSENKAHVDQVLIPAERLSHNRWLEAVKFVEGNLDDGSRTRHSLGFLKPVIRHGFLERTALHYAEIRFSEDFLFYLKCLLHGASWFITPAPMYCYTVREASLTDSVCDADLLYLSAVERRLGDEAARRAPALAAAIRRHRRSVDNSLCWSRFARAIKRRDWRTERDTVRDDPRKFMHICHQGFRTLSRGAAAGLAPRQPSA